MNVPLFLAGMLACGAAGYIAPKGSLPALLLAELGMALIMIS